MNSDKLLERIAIALEELVKIGNKLAPNTYSSVVSDDLNVGTVKCTRKLPGGEFHECAGCGRIRGIEQLDKRLDRWMCRDTVECSKG